MAQYINVSDQINISEYINAKFEIDAVIYRDEFFYNYKEYLKTGLKSKLIFSFIFLQIYIECFLHQNMRRIIELEFKNNKKDIYLEWIKKEKNPIEFKMEDFVKIFFSLQDDIENLKKIIKDEFKKIKDIRNMFVHGHEVATWSDSSGDSGETDPHSFLNVAQLNKSIDEVNMLGNTWNSLLKNILHQCVALKKIEDFKFKKIENEK